MTKAGADTAKVTLREWLRNERRLGIQHVERRLKQPPSPVAAPAAAMAAPKPQARPISAPTTLKLLGDDPDLPALCDRELALDEARQELDRIDATFVRGCKKCRLHENRTRTVFGVGYARPEIAFVGEGPGADEDRDGIPFVGRAGQLLTRMIAAMKLTREQVYICNIVKCRPPGNRTPADDEMETCSPYLWRQLAIVRPKVIVALGRPAAQTLLATNVPIGKLRGEFHDFPPPALAHLGLPPCKLMPTFHPAYLLRSPGEKAKAWQDLQQVMGLLGIELPRGQR